MSFQAYVYVWFYGTDNILHIIAICSIWGHSPVKLLCFTFPSLNLFLVLGRRIGRNPIKLNSMLTSLIGGAGKPAGAGREGVRAGGGINTLPPNERLKKIKNNFARVL